MLDKIMVPVDLAHLDVSEPSQRVVVDQPPHDEAEGSEIASPPPRPGSWRAPRKRSLSSVKPSRRRGPGSTASQPPYQH